MRKSSTRKTRNNVVSNYPRHPFGESLPRVLEASQTRDINPAEGLGRGIEDLRKDSLMKFSALLCLLILCSIAAQAQTKATTEDGKNLTKSQSIVLDQYNARRMWQY